MKIIVTARNFKLTEALKSTIHLKLEKFSKMLESDEKIKVILDAHKHIHTIEIFMTIKNKIIIVKKTDENLYVALDLVIDKLKNQLERFSEKSNNRSSIKYLTDSNDEIDNEDESLERISNKIVKRKSFNLKPMNEEEAILQMETLGHHSFMFYNDYTESMSLLYRRKDGLYGLITTN